MATQTSTRKRSAALNAQTEQATPSAEAIRVKTIIDALAALHDQGVEVEPSGQDELRWVAEDLGVPFFVVWLAQELRMDTESTPDLDDILHGLDWLREREIPLEHLRRPVPYDTQWRTSLAALATDKDAAHEEVQKAIQHGAVRKMDRYAKAAAAAGVDTSRWFNARKAQGEL